MDRRMALTSATAGPAPSYSQRHSLVRSGSRRGSVDPLSKCQMPPSGLALSRARVAATEKSQVAGRKRCLVVFVVDQVEQVVFDCGPVSRPRRSTDSPRRSRPRLPQEPGDRHSL